MPMLQKYGRDYVLLYKNKPEGFCLGEILSVYQVEVKTLVL